MARNRKLHLNREERKFLGVCAGIADYLEVEPWTVRLLFLVALLMGAWFLIPVYFGFWFCLGNTSESFRDNSTVRHFRNVDYKKRLYRNAEEGKFLGVCAGIADYLEVDVTVVRLITFVLLFIAGPIPWFAYFGAYFVLDKKPLHHPGYQRGAFAAAPPPPGEEPPPREEFKPRRRDMKNCARKFSHLQYRLARMEAYVTSPQFKLHREFRSIS